jgi:hypothetical protein
MAHCKRDGAVLIIAKSDRFRNTAEALKIYEEMGDGNIMFCDLPTTEKFTLTLFFALAEREALLVSIRTKQALAALKARGDVKLGGASEKYKENRAAKSKETLVSEERRRASARTKSFLQRPDSVAFLKVIRRTFPQCCNGDDIAKWNWGGVNYKSASITKMAMIMRDFKEMNSSLFASWDLSDITSKETKRKVTTYVNTFKRSASTYIYYSQAE